MKPRTQAFRTKVAEQIAQAGFGTSSFTWTSGPSRLVLIVNGTLKEFPMHAGMSRVRLAHHLGKIEAYGEMLKAA